MFRREPAFQNGWGNSGGTNQVAGFRKTPEGEVVLLGRITDGTTGTVAFPLPVGHRPTKYRRFVVQAGASGAGYALVSSTGTVEVGVGSGIGTVSLEGVRFDAA